MKKFRFGLLETVEVSSRETGIVIARAEYHASEDSYLIRYVGGGGRLVEQWWGDSALTPSGAAASAQAA